MQNIGYIFLILLYNTIHFLNTFLLNNIHRPKGLYNTITSTLYNLFVEFTSL